MRASGRSTRRAVDGAARPGPYAGSRGSWSTVDLSHGDRRKLELAMALASAADGPAPRRADGRRVGGGRRGPEQIIGEVRDAGVTVAMVEHHMHVVLGLADRVAVLHHGAAARGRNARRGHVRRARPAGLPGRRTVTDGPRCRLSVDDLHVHYGGSHILQGVTSTCPPRGVTALLGRNGVGKTTTLKAILGLAPRTGSDRVCRGNDIQTGHDVPYRSGRHRLRARRTERSSAG